MLQWFSFVLCFGVISAGCGMTLRKLTLYWHDGQGCQRMFAAWNSKKQNPPKMSPTQVVIVAKVSTPHNNKAIWSTIWVMMNLFGGIRILGKLSGGWENTGCQNWSGCIDNGLRSLDRYAPRLLVLGMPWFVCHPMLRRLLSMSCADTPVSLLFIAERDRATFLQIYLLLLFEYLHCPEGPLPVVSRSGGQRRELHLHQAVKDALKLKTGVNH